MEGDEHFPKWLSTVAPSGKRRCPKSRPGKVKGEGPSLGSPVSFYSHLCASMQKLHDVLEQECAFFYTEREGSL